MHYRAEAFDIESEELAVDLLSWESRKAAQQACEQHAMQTLTFSERWRGCWEARADVHWYRILGSAK